jgi:hypothetical protein
VSGDNSRVNINSTELAAELAKLRKVLLVRAQSPEHYTAIEPLRQRKQKRNPVTHRMLNGRYLLWALLIIRSIIRENYRCGF